MMKKLLSIILGISCMVLSGCHQKVVNNNFDNIKLDKSELVVIFEEDVYCHEDLFGAPLESYWDFDFVKKEQGKRVKVFWGKIEEKEKNMILSEKNTLINLAIISFKSCMIIP